MKEIPIHDGKIKEHERDTEFERHKSINVSQQIVNSFEN